MSMLLYLLLVLGIAIIPFALRNIIRNQATEWDFGAVVLNSLCLFQLYKYMYVPIASPTYAAGAGTFFSVVLLVPICGLLSVVWTVRALLPRLSQKNKAG